MTPNEINEIFSIALYVANFATIIYAFYVVISIYRMNKGIYDAWLVDKQEVNKKISWNLEFNDPKRYLDGLIRHAGQFPTEAYPEFNYENYNYEG